MDAMPMSGAEAMSVAWTPLCGGSWIDAAASFLAMWTVMMAAMMLPSLLAALRGYHRTVGGAGGLPSALLTCAVAGGYLLIWTLLGAAVYPIGAAVMAVTMRCPPLMRALPVAAGLVVLLAGALQLSRRKARALACCRDRWRGGRAPCGHVTRASPVAALGEGLRLGLHCIECCAGLTAALLVTGIMSWPGMLATTLALNLERLAPDGERVARAVGLVTIGAGLLLTARALSL